MTTSKQPETKLKFELGGLLVYDSKACISHSANPQVQAPPALSVKKEMTKSSHSGSFHSDYSAFLRMKYHTPDPPFISEYSLEVPMDGVTLTFNSKFESGNLHKAVKISDYEYMLYVNSDTNTCDQNHWYYFSVTNPRKTSITFKITNLLKKDLLYCSGMKPCVYSTQSFCQNGISWVRDGYDLSYVENAGDPKGLRFVGSKKYFTLSFTYDFRYENDLVFFAYAVPYTYTQLELYLNDIASRHPAFVRVDPLCKSLGGNVCRMVTITQSVKDYFPFEQEAAEWSVSSNSRKLAKLKNIKKDFQDKKLGNYKANKHLHKKAVVLTARVHSGETVSSYMMKGAIDFLISASRPAKLLRKNFVFKIIPMLNPDGCKYGNYRCSLLGIDLNRRWNQPNKALHPTIYFAKKMIEAVSEKHELVLVCDMHGHTKKRNVFMYGCGVRSYEPSIVRRNVMARVVPYLFSLRNKFFSFKDSHFRMEDDRKATARVVLWESFNISHCYTMEASFYGPEKLSAFGKNRSEDFHMDEKDLATLGADLCKLCLIFKDQRIYMRKFQMTNDFLRHLMEIRGLKFFNRLNKKNLDGNGKNFQVGKDLKDGKVYEAESFLKKINKENKMKEKIEIGIIEESGSIEENCQDEIGEGLWENIEVTKVEPDSDSGGSDSNCSFDRSENISTTNTEVQPKAEESKALISKKSKIMKLVKFPKNTTPQPSISKSFKKQENLFQNPISSPKALSPKKSDCSNTETPIIPQVFVFPEDKSPDYFNPIVNHFHIKSLSLQKKIDKRIKNRVESIPSSCERYSMKPEDDISYSIETGKVFGKIGGNKLLNDFFNVNRKQHSHSLALSTRFKIEKKYLVSNS
jgi:hypothetical protein